MINVINYGEKCPQKLVIALGYFDAVHAGHISVLKTAVDKAKNDYVSAALIFKGGKSNKDIFTLPERVLKIAKSGIQTVIIKELTPDFLAKSPSEFLTELTALYDIDTVVTGSDFTFGKGALGNVQTLINYFGEDKVKTVELISYDGGEKLSSSKIKSLLESGDVIKVNELLGSNYFISGEVIKGKGLGRKLGFPTANLRPDKDKFLPKSGVYVTAVIIAGNFYSAITNVGEQPTVNGSERLIETYIDGFSGDLYGKRVSVYFIERLRDIVKFNGVEELKAQLEKDLRSIK